MFDKIPMSLCKQNCERTRKGLANQYAWTYVTHETIEFVSQFGITIRVREREDPN
jgi:hypothetical protein